MTGRALFALVVVASSIHGVLNAAPVLTLDDRAAAQRAIEEVYWRHRIWPEGNSGGKPSLEALASDSVIRAKVERYLAKSAALEERRGRAITPDELMVELDGIATS